MRGKRVSAVLRALAPLRPEPIFTRVSDAGARSPASLLAAWRRIGADGASGRIASEPGQALRMAAAARRDDEQEIVVAGSLYLVGAVRASLLGEEALA
jgi:folylpolyglutamate synthase/dihydropteroate synthase